MQNLLAKSAKTSEQVENLFLFSVRFETVTNVTCNVYWGPMTHIVTSDSKFISFDNDFNPENHHTELADGTRSNNIAIKR